MVLVLAFAPYEPRPLLAAAELFRGMAIQLSYRWGAGRVCAEPSDRAVLLWSVCGPRGRREFVREVRGILTSVMTGIVLFAASNALLFLIVGEVLDACGTSPGTVSAVRLGIVAFRLSVTLWRAWHAYLHDKRLELELPAQRGLRWRIDLMAASPACVGHGRDLLSHYLERADAVDAEVVLNCDSRNRSFYSHHGFVLAAERGPGGQLLMIRPARTARGSQSRPGQRRLLLGHLRKGSAEAPPSDSRTARASVRSA